MKKTILFFSIFLLVGCNQISLDQEETVTTEEITLGELSCLTSYEAKEFDEDMVNTSFEHTKDYFLAQIPTLFQNQTFIDLKAKSNVASLCVWDDQTAFILYGEFGEFNNAIGLLTDEGLVTTYENNRGGGDIGLCQISGYLDGLLYECGGGDGPGGHYKRSVLIPSGEAIVLQDCTYSSENSDETITTCQSDSLEW